MDPTDEDNPNYFELLYSQTDDEGEDADKLEEEKAKKAEAKKKLEVPGEWDCGVCTMINPYSATKCEVCATGDRPSDADIIAAAKQKLADQADASKEARDAEAE